MKKFFGIIVLILTAFVSCKNTPKQSIEKFDIQEVRKENYVLNFSSNDIKKVLILFGGFGEKPEDIKREFNILEIAKENNTALIYMNYNQKLWLEENEKRELSGQLQKIFQVNNLPRKDIYFGGFSSGGNVTLLISSFLIENKIYNLKPKGVFIIDSPIDLVALYRSSEKNLKRNFSEVSVQESKWIIETLGNKFGNPTDNILKYQDYAVYTSTTNYTDNLKSLKNTKMRFYTEPDTLWWKENRKADFDQMNAFYIKILYENLNKIGFDKVEYLPTENKGFRANGVRHPHSWSIVDKEDLMQWMNK
ncbi:hypothetical protein [Lacihabitans soyangensis]|uniref:Alpha/beta hydrolase n=1 Tax=Lacihabitans soyangensis TaxID=869394 RepID=A0AAE3H4V7_9BACT|nr:hypothetical protein [Lacihabitans soyangensis]MCP9763050.1 hypothetical protein [Lacihabitans soyangensis]